MIVVIINDLVIGVVLILEVHHHVAMSLWGEKCFSSMVPGACFSYCTSTYLMVVRSVVRPPHILMVFVRFNCTGVCTFQLY